MWQQEHYVREKLRALEEAQRLTRRSPVGERSAARPAARVLRAAGRTLSGLGRRLESWAGPSGETEVAELTLREKTSGSSS